MQNSNNTYVIEKIVYPPVNIPEIGIIPYVDEQCDTKFTFKCSDGSMLYISAREATYICGNNVGVTPREIEESPREEIAPKETYISPFSNREV